MMKPLKLRLFITDVTTEGSGWVMNVFRLLPPEAGQPRWLEKAVGTLQFENPMNGTWHPIETVEAQKEKPPEGG